VLPIASSYYKEFAKFVCTTTAKKFFIKIRSLIKIKTWLLNKLKFKIRSNIPTLQKTERKRIPASSSAEVRQLVDHLSEQTREVASEASMERTPRALAMWMAGLTLAFTISIALAQKVWGYTGY